MEDNEIYIRTIAAEVTNRNDYSQDGIQKTSKKGENGLRKIGSKIKEDHNLTEKTDEITHKLVLKVYGITILICLFYFLLPQNVCSQTYLRKRLSFNILTANDSLTLSRTLENAKKWYRFKSKKCTATIGYLDSLLKYYSVKEKKINNRLIAITCGFDFNENSYENRTDLKNDSLLFSEKILKNDFFENGILSLIDRQRFEIAKYIGTKESYFEYLDACDFPPNQKLEFKKAAEDSIFNIYTPHLYANAMYYVKLNELIGYLEDSRNKQSSNYFKALKCLYLIYTNDGELSTIEKLKTNLRFLSCKQECSTHDQNYIDSLINADIIDSKVYERILHEKPLNQDLMKIFIEKNLPKESAYIVLQKFIKGHIELEEFIEAAIDVEAFLKEDDKRYKLFPEMKHKMKATINLLEDSRDKKVKQYELPFNKAKLGYGPISKVFPTKNSYYIAIRDSGYSNLGRIDGDSINNTLQTGNYAYDVSYDEKRACVLQNHKFYEISTDNERNIQDYFRSNEKKSIKITKKSIQTIDTLKEITIVNSKNDYYLSSQVFQHINNKKWLQLDIDKDIVSIEKGITKPFEGAINGRYEEKDAYMQDDTIYFSSNSFYGFGGYDIFMSIRNGNSWTNPVNLGFGVNSPYDDVCFRRANNQNIFICENKKDSLPRIALTTNEINPKKRVFFLSLVTPRKGDPAKEVHVKYVDRKGKEKELHQSFIEGNTLNIKLDSDVESDSSYLIISYMNKNMIGETQINLDSITFPDFNMDDTIITLPDNKKELDIREINPSILSPKIFNKYMGATVIKEHPKSLNLGNNLLKWRVIFPDRISNDFIVERNIKLEYKNSKQDSNTLKKGVKVTIFPNNKLEEKILRKGETETFVVYFETNESSMKSKEAEKIVERTTSFLKNIYEQEAKYGKNDGSSSFEFSYLGFADVRGTSSHNLELSIGRSIHVKEYLKRKNYREEIEKNIKHNLPRGRGKTDAFGKDKATIEEQWQENRRVIVTVKWN